MKQTNLENRVSLASMIAVGVIVSVFVFSERSSSAALTSGAEESVIAQVENILATSARHVFDEDYWIANMHSIRSSQFK